MLLAAASGLALTSIVGAGAGLIVLVGVPVAMAFRRHKRSPGDH